MNISNNLTTMIIEKNISDSTGCIDKNRKMTIRDLDSDCKKDEKEKLEKLTLKKKKTNCCPIQLSENTAKNTIIINEKETKDNKDKKMTTGTDNLDPDKTSQSNQNQINNQTILTSIKNYVNKKLYEVISIFSIFLFRKAMYTTINLRKRNYK